MKYLNRPIAINHIELHNRLVMPPMATAKATEDGKVTPQLCHYYEEKAAGGYIGLIITEHSYVNLASKAGKGQLSIAEDGDVQGLEQLVRSIHQMGSKVMAQISHAGGAAKREVTGCPVLGPSAVPMPKTCFVPSEMSLADIQNVIADFAAAALRAKKAGFDGVEIHSAHGYLLNQFYSPLANQRQDAYGPQSLEGRLRLHLEIIQAIRQKVGTQYPVALRLGACDCMDGGTTLEDSVLAAQILEQAGIDLLDISGGFSGYTHPCVSSQGYFSEWTEAIKKAVHIPVLLTGGIVDAQAAESLLTQGKADLIGVGRAILKDSLWPQKAFCQPIGE